MPPALVLQEVRDLLCRGYKEVVFSGIHLGTYGRDIEPRTTFYELLRSVLSIDSLQRIRLSSIEPLEVTPEIIDLVASDSRVARHFHIPLQSGSSRILRAMYRPYTADYYRGLIDGIRTAIPDASIGADVMVGFPGESDEDFALTCELIQGSPLTYLHVFPFSSRPGTAAENLPYPVPDHVAKHRAKLLRHLIAEKNHAFRRSFIGRDMDVLVLEDDAENGGRAAISSNFLRVRVPEALAVNEWVAVTISGLDDDGLVGDYVSKTTTAHDIRMSCVSET
jgi:threonylcarbamoyladenosine tRNA methylthiotransferase MtaB